MAAEQMLARLPNVRPTAQWNRAFPRRVVRYLVRARRSVPWCARCGYRAYSVGLVV